MTVDATATYREVQHFRQWWIFALAAVPVWIAWVAFFQQILSDGTFGDDPAPDVVIWGLFLVVGLLLPVGLWRLRLETSVHPGRLEVRFPPFRARVVDLHTVLDVQPVRVRALGEWGGYGYRRNLRGDVAFLVSGEGGVRLALGDDKVLVVGSGQPEVLTTAIVEAQRYIARGPS